MQTQETISAFFIQSPKLRTTFIPGLHSLPDTIVVDSIMLQVYACSRTHSYQHLPCQIPQEMEIVPLDDFYAVLEPWSDTENTNLLGTFSRSHQILHIHEENVQKHHTVVLIFLCHVTLELLNGKTSFQSHIVKQHKSYRMVVES